VQVIGVHRKPEKLVITLLVMIISSGLRGASRTCAYFRDSTAEFKFNFSHIISPLLSQLLPFTQLYTLETLLIIDLIHNEYIETQRRGLT